MGELVDMLKPFVMSKLERLVAISIVAGGAYVMYPLLKGDYNLEKAGYVSEFISALGAVGVGFFLMADASRREEDAFDAYDKGSSEYASPD